MGSIGAVAIGVAIFGAFGGAAANDSSATLGAGGIVLTQSDSIVLEREDLYISTDEIRIRYEFESIATEDQTTTVAFPLPPIDLAVLSEVPVDRPGDDPINFVDFTVSADGRRLAPSVHLRALHGGEVITDYLLSKNLKLSFFDGGFYDSLLDLDPDARQDMMDRGYAYYDEYGAVYPQWTLETVFSWPQIFPAGGRVSIEHSYKPVVGQSFVSKYSLEGDELAPFCVDDAAVQAIRKRIKQRSTTADEDGLLIARSVEYILSTAGNWRGPIGHFRLTLDKGAPERLISLCFDGEIRKTSPTTFVAEIDDYEPRSDLRILVLE